MEIDWIDQKLIQNLVDLVEFENSNWEEESLVSVGIHGFLCNSKRFIIFILEPKRSIRQFRLLKSDRKLRIVTDV